MNTLTKPTNLFIVGDSTVANYTKSTYPQAGWGQMIGEQLGSTTQVYNYALNGRSSKSFINEGHLEILKSKISAEDFLMIQFGHHDEKKEDPARYTEPSTTYKKNLKHYIHVAKNTDATPILVTPVSRRTFNHTDKITNTHYAYCQAMVEVSKETQTHLIDLCQKSKYLFERFGAENSKQLFMINDNTHFNINGAKVISSLVIEGLMELNLPENLIIPY